MAYGIQGEGRLSYVPELEMAGVPYTGSSPLGHGLAFDKVITKRLIRHAGVPTPNFRVMRRGTESTGDPTGSEPASRIQQLWIAAPCMSPLVCGRP